MVVVKAQGEWSDKKRAYRGHEIQVPDGVGIEVENRVLFVLSKDGTAIQVFADDQWQSAVVVKEPEEDSEQ